MRRRMLRLAFITLSREFDLRLRLLILSISFRFRLFTERGSPALSWHSGKVHELRPSEDLVPEHTLALEVSILSHRRCLHPPGPTPRVPLSPQLSMAAVVYMCTVSKQ